MLSTVNSNNVATLVLLLTISFICVGGEQHCDPTCIHGDCTGDTCECQENWFGDDCNTFICKHNSPCLNDGKCSRGEGNQFTCSCETGFSGILCDCNDGYSAVEICRDTDLCEHGTCIIEPVFRNKTCVCDAGYGGDKCNMEIDPCLTRGCQNGGTCRHIPDESKDPPVWFTCECPMGYKSNFQCAVPETDSCYNDPCGENGNCSLPVPLDIANGPLYICSCFPGFTGVNCTSSFSHCDENPCQHNATCNEFSDHSGYNCTCPAYFTGDNCETDYDPCDSISCENDGECISMYEVDPSGQFNYTANCSCTSSFNGSHCQFDIDECALHVCENGGTCVNTHGGFVCVCSNGFEGERCKVNIDDCISNPCQNGGLCIDGNNTYSCNCSQTQYTGPICNVSLSETCSVQKCHFGGICEMDSYTQQPTCNCQSGYSGQFCLFKYQHCINGTLDCDINETETQCVNNTDPPPCSVNNPCSNGGTCMNGEESFFCHCPSGYSGDTCEITGCQDLRCLNGGECIRHNNEEFCNCTSEWGGVDCSFDIDECFNTSCRNGGTCINTLGGYNCVCPDQYTGEYCEDFICGDVNPCKNGGSCTEEDGCTCADGYEGILCEKEVCPYSNCSQLANNERCDRHCFISSCNFDGNDPCYTRPGIVDPWANCPQDSNCIMKYNDSKCDQECNNGRCNYDGGDCDPMLECPSEIVESCEPFVDNGICDETCNTAECPLDTSDCGQQLYLPNYLVLIISSTVSINFEGEARDSFLTSLGRLIHAVVEVVEYREISEDEVTQYEDFVPLDFTGHTNNRRYWRVVMRVNIQYCISSCPTSVQQVLDTIQAAYSNGETQIADFDLLDASEEPSDNEGEPGGSNPIAIYVTVPVCIVLVLIVVVVLGKRVRDNGGVKETFRKIKVRRTWRVPGGTTPEPDSNTITREQSFVSDRRSGSIETMIDSPCSHRKSDALPHFTWSQIEVPVNISGTDGSVCVVGERGQDDRQWTHLHCEAARSSGENIKDLIARQNGRNFDINAQGRGGFTPLMIAIISEDRRHKLRPAGPVRSDSSSGSDYSEYDTLVLSRSPRLPRMFSTIPLSKPMELRAPAFITAPNTDLNMVNDQGQTALHLAVKYGREEYIHYLLIAKANPNIQDIWKQTPLHVAIGAAADRAFQILLDNPKTNIEIKSVGGVTPLILSVKMGNNRMVQQLIAKSAEITASDDDGRTAVHWAAMINNVDALKLLVKQGPDNVKDAPDHKGETALFLACREGSAASVRHLLDCYANATLVDSLDRSPLQIAYEKRHIDIVEMLQQSSQGPLVPPPPVYTMTKPNNIPHSAHNPLFRTGSVKLEPGSMVMQPVQVPPPYSQSSTQQGIVAHYPPTITTSSNGMSRYPSIEAELERLVASTMYPPFPQTEHCLSHTSPPYVPSYTNSTVSQTQLINSTAIHTVSGMMDGGQSSPGNSVISPTTHGGVSPGVTMDPNTSNFSPSGSDVYTVNHSGSPGVQLTAYSCQSCPTDPSVTCSTATSQSITGSTPLQHLPFKGTSSLQQCSLSNDVQSTSTSYNTALQNIGVHNGNGGHSPLMAQTVSPNPPLTIAQAQISGYSSPQVTIATENHSPSSHYGFPSPPKEGGEYLINGTPFSNNPELFNNLTPSPEDYSMQQGENSPNTQHTTIHGQYYTTEPYSLQPHYDLVQSHLPSDMMTFNAKESTV